MNSQNQIEIAYAAVNFARKAYDDACEANASVEVRVRLFAVYAAANRADRVARNETAYPA